MDLLFYDSPVGRPGLMGEDEALIALALPNQPVPLIMERDGRYTHWRAKPAFKITSCFEVY